MVVVPDIVAAANGACTVQVFTRTPEAFELRDLDCYDVVVAVDSATREEVLAQVEPQCQQYYRCDE
jgi:hypothetical protein